MRTVSVALLLTIMGGAAVPAAAQHATGEDLTDGERAYGETCVVCHGPDGDLIAGIDLGRGLFRRDYSDAELVGIIMNGIPETPMPPTPGMSVEQAERIVAYLRARAADASDPAAGGDPARGAALFFGAGECASCHAVFGEGARHGPDLSRIGLERGAAELEAALLDPAASVQPTARNYRAVLADGEVVTGRLLNHDSYTVQLIDTNERLRSLVKAELAEHGFAATTMPSYRGELSGEQIADLVAYLASLQGHPDE